MINTFDVIAIHGKAGSGKSAVADSLLWKFKLGPNFDGQTPVDVAQLHKQLDLDPVGLMPVEIVALSGTLKEWLYATGRCDETDILADQKSKEQRHVFTSHGDSLRHDQGQNYFCRALYARMLISAKVNNTGLFIIPDLREKHEMEFLRAMRSEGHIDNLRFVTVHAPKRAAYALSQQVGDDEEARVQQSSHSSEVGLDDITKDRETAEAHGFIFFNNDIREN